MDNSKRHQPLSLRGTTLAIFAKQPVAGQVKTRLCPPLTPEEAAGLYQTALEETVTRLAATSLPMVLCYAGEAAWFRARFPGIPLLAQSAGDLGDRLQQASRVLFAAGAGPLLVVGSDSPDLPLAQLEAARTALADADLVTIPCHDGGYALVGLRTDRPEVFAEIPWSSAQVLDATRRKAAEHDLAYREVGGWDDLDDLAALHRLLVRSPDSATARCLRAELGHHLGNPPAVDLP